MKQGTQSRCSGTTQGDGMEGGGRGVQDENIEISSIAINEKKNTIFLEDES